MWFSCHNETSFICSKCEEEEPDEEVGQEDTENGSKGIEEMNDEVHIIDIIYS